MKHKRADATELPFDSNYFDACRSERVFPHLIDPAKALSEMARVAKPGGWIVVFDPDAGSVSMDADDIESERRLVRVFAEHMINNGYVGRRLYRLFKEQGLEDVTAQVCGFHCTDYALARQLGTLRSHKLSSPLSSITLSTYLPSGEIAARAALPVFVTCVTVKFPNGLRAGRCKRE